MARAFEGPQTTRTSARLDSTQGMYTLAARGGGAAPAPSAPRHAPDKGRHFPLMVHCHLRWDFVWQRPQQLFSRLANDHAVLFIEDPLPHDGEARLDISEPFPDVVRLVPRLPHGTPGDSDDHWRLFVPLIEEALQRHPLLANRFADPVQWFYSPMSAPVMLGRFGARGTVYDCMDELANFRFAPPDIAARERYLLSRADVVFTGGYHLYEAKARHHSTVYVHGCGVDVGHFGRARLASTQVPDAVASIPPAACWPTWAWRSISIDGPTSSRAASSSAWRSRARW